MIFDVITIFPNLFESVFAYGIVKRAIEREIIHLRIHDLRQFTTDAHRTVDDKPYGGGEGMILKPEPIFDAVEKIVLEAGAEEKRTVILLSPQGTLFDQKHAMRLSQLDRVILICGRYEGVDQRVADALADEEISIGDYVLSGGEIPGMIIIDSVTRLLPNVLGGGTASAVDESFARGMLDFPQYTRPADFRGMKVPDVLLSGDHEKIKKWRQEKALERTKKFRPDLLNKGPCEG